MSMGNPYQNNGLSLNLSQSGAPLSNVGSPYALPNMGMGMGMGMQQQGAMNPMMGGMQQQQPSFGGSLLAGFTGQDPYQQQAVLPPSDTEILMTMLDNAYPVERFLATPFFSQLLEMIGMITTFSVLNLMKNATYAFDEDSGKFSLDISSLPAELQTMSSENVSAQLASMNAQLTQVINQANAVKMQTMQNASNSMLQAQLANAMSDPGLMTGAAEAGGSFMRNMLFGGRA
jgi:hypothetical protein